jgi:hypothetical protein
MNCSPGTEFYHAIIDQHRRKYEASSNVAERKAILDTIMKEISSQQFIKTNGRAAYE